MTSMAKVFVVVNLILAVVAFGSAAVLLGTKDDYKQASENMKAKFESVQTALRGEQTRLENELAQQTNRAAAAVTGQQNAEENAAGTAKQLNDAQTVNRQLRATIETLTAEVAAANKINGDNKNWLDRLVQENKKSTQDKVDAVKKLEQEIANRVQLEQQVNDLTESVKNAAAENGDLAKQLRDLKFWNDEYKKRFGNLSMGRGSAGRVDRVMDNLVSISVGSRDGVRAGDKYSLRRGGAFVGTIRITKVERDLALGVITSTGSGAPPQTGDTAAPSAQ